MKRICAIIAFVALVTGASAQSQWIGFKGFFRESNATSIKMYVDQSGVIKAPLTGVWQARFNTGMEAVALYPKLDEAGKMIGIDPRAFSKFIAGVFFTHTKPDGFQDWAAGAMVTIPNPASGYDNYGIAIGGAYSIFKVGLNYDFGLPFKQGFAVLSGIKIDLFNVIQ